MTACLHQSNGENFCPPEPNIWTTPFTELAYTGIELAALIALALAILAAGLAVLLWARRHWGRS